MRTTVTLEPDVVDGLHRVMRERDISFKEAVNAAIRTGLEPPVPAPVAIMTAHLGKPRIDLTHGLRIAGDLEDKEIIRRMRPRR